MVKIKYIKLYKSNYTHTHIVESVKTEEDRETETELQETQRWGEKE